jgi:hypothetical protein
MCAGFVVWRPGGIVADVGRDPLPAMEALDRRGSEPGVDDLVHERKRHGVVVPVELDMVVDVDAGGLPLAVDEGLGRQWPQGRSVQPLEQLAPARLVEAHAAAIEVLAQLGDPRVQCGHREERLVPESGEDPSLRDLNTDLNFRLVPTFPRAGRQEHGAVVLAQVFVGALEARLVAAGHGDAALQLIRVLCRPPLCGQCCWPGGPGKAEDVLGAT